MVCGIIPVSRFSKWSELVYEFVVKEMVMQPDREVRLIVARTSEIYGHPAISLGIRESTKLLDARGKEIPISDFKQGTAVEAAFDEYKKGHSRGNVLLSCFVMKIRWKR